MAFYTDEIDRANELAQVERDEAEAEIRRRASAIPAGEPGVCRECEQFSPRLVDGHCAPCRDLIGC